MRKVILIGLCAGLAATGCKRGGNSAADNGRADVESIPVDIEQESKPLDCPEGTTNRTADRGAREWCERPDGTRHGPSVFRLRCNRVPTRNETYRDGVLEGDAISWHVAVPVNGHLMSRARLGADAPTRAFTQPAVEFLARTSNECVEKPFEPDKLRALIDERFTSP